MHEVIDNFLEPEDFKQIQTEIMLDTFPWYFINGVAFKGSNDYYFIHTFYFNYSVLSDWFKILDPFIKKLNPKAIIRIKANLYPNIKGLHINEPHVDQDYQCKSAVLYLNTCNGYTRLGKDIVINSVENRVLLFNSSKPHNSTHCTDQHARLTLNINYF
jgi:hypothetical protein